MNQEQLQSLKAKILNDIAPLAMQSSDNSDRFGLLLRVIQAGGANNDVFSRAYESAMQIQDKDEQLDSLLALLDEVDFEANRPEEVEDASENTNQPSYDDRPENAQA